MGDICHGDIATMLLWRTGMMQTKRCLITSRCIWHSIWRAGGCTAVPRFSQKDYKVHIPVVRILLEKKYDPLVGISAEGLTEDANLDLLEEVCERIRRAYAAEQPSFEGTTNNATDTLVTKILLGTLGCVPAYDRYYVQAVKQYNISAGVYSKESVRDVAVYYLSHMDEFESLREELSTCGTRYPAMKLMDMCMWQLAFETDKRKEP